MEKSLLTTITAAAILALSGCGQAGSDTGNVGPVLSQAGTDAYNTVNQYSSENGGTLPPNASALSAYAVQKGIKLAYPVIDLSAESWKMYSQTPRPAIGNGALHNLIGYYVDQNTKRFGICTEAATLSNQ